MARTDGLTDPNTVRASGRGVFHGEEDRAESADCRTQGEGTGTHSGKPAGKIRGISPAADCGCDPRTYPHKELVQLGVGGLRHGALCGPPAVSHLPHIAKY